MAFETNNANTATAPGAPLRLRYALVLAAASAAMMGLSLPGYEQWCLSFVSLAPLLVVLQRARLRTTLLSWWLGGLAFFLIAVWWLKHLTPIGMVALALYLSISFLLFAFAARFILSRKPRLPFVVTVPLLWVAVELLRGLPLGGFCWHYIGHNFYRQTSFIQIADFSGVYGISFVAVCVNACLARAVHAALAGEFSSRRTRLLFGAAVAAALVAATLAYGLHRLGETTPVEGPTVSVVQGNIPQELKEVAMSAHWTLKTSLDRQDWIFDTYENLTLKLKDVRDDLVVWPETMTPPLEGLVFYWSEDNLAAIPSIPGQTHVTIEGKHYTKLDGSSMSEARVRELRRALGRPLLVGSARFERVDNELLNYNGAYFFPQEQSPLRAYFKMYPVPFGEFIPFRNVRVIRAIVEGFMPEGYEAALSPGKEIVLFEAKGVPFATPICYEDTKPSLIAAFRSRGARFIVNLTNDGWFRDTVELDQHLANSVFRTVENRVGLVRAANTGISAFITPAGVIASFVKDSSGRFRAVAGVLTDRVLLDDRRTLYTKYGDVFAWGTVILSGLMALGAGFGRRSEL